MKVLKVVGIPILVISVIVGFYFLGMFVGADKVRAGLLENYPTVKNIVQGADTEIDSSLEITVTSINDTVLFKLLAGKNDSVIKISIPYYSRYGIDLAVRHFRFFINDDKEVEMWLPPLTLLYCELKFDDAVINNGNRTIVITPEFKRSMYNYIIPLLEKDKASQKRGKLTVTKVVMYYFMPYKFGLRLYIGKEYQDLPLVPGANQTVEEAAKNAFGNK